MEKFSVRAMSTFVDPMESEAAELLLKLERGDIMVGDLLGPLYNKGKRCATISARDTDVRAAWLCVRLEEWSARAARAARRSRSRAEARPPVRWRRASGAAIRRAE